MDGVSLRGTLRRHGPGEPLSTKSPSPNLRSQRGSENATFGQGHPSACKMRLGLSRSWPVGSTWAGTGGAGLSLCADPLGRAARVQVLAPHPAGQPGHRRDADRSDRHCLGGDAQCPGPSHTVDADGADLDKVLECLDPSQ
jgi:hypothetical protein